MSSKSLSSALILQESFFASAPVALSKSFHLVNHSQRLISTLGERFLRHCREQHRKLALLDVLDYLARRHDALRTLVERQPHMTRFEPTCLGNGKTYSGDSSKNEPANAACSDQRAAGLHASKPRTARSHASMSPSSPALTLLPSVGSLRRATKSGCALAVTARTCVRHTAALTPIVVACCTMALRMSRDTVCEPASAAAAAAEASVVILHAPRTHANDLPARESVNGG
jgi:hypothetical protein